MAILTRRYKKKTLVNLADSRMRAPIGTETDALRRMISRIAPSPPL